MKWDKDKGLEWVLECIPGPDGLKTIIVVVGETLLGIPTLAIAKKFIINPLCGYDDNRILDIIPLDEALKWTWYGIVILWGVPLVTCLLALTAIFFYDMFKHIKEPKRFITAACYKQKRHHQNNKKMFWEGISLSLFFIGLISVPCIGALLGELWGVVVFVVAFLVSFLFSTIGDSGS